MDAIDQTFIRTLCEAVQAGEAVRRTLPAWGRIYLDPERPFLCVYRRPPARRDPATGRLVTSQAAYLLAPGDAPFHDGLAALLEALTATMAGRYGAVCLAELWSTADEGEAEEADPATLRPTFRLLAPEAQTPHPAVQKLATGLQRITIHEQIADVAVECAAAPAPPGLKPLLTPALGDACLRIGLEAEPFYREAGTGAVFPFLFDHLRRQLDEALRRTFFAFTRTGTALEPPHFLAMGRSSLDRATKAVDQALAKIDAAFDFLLLTTPVNSGEAWEAFRASGFEEAPVFRYRPLPVDPELLKRDLFDVPVERVDDPVLAWIFREKQEELDRRITMLRDRGTRQFFFGSLQLFGEVEPDLLHLAHEILEHLPVRDEDYDAADYFTAEEFADVAVQEFDRYREGCPLFPDAPQIRDDVPAGLMVSSGQLLIGAETTIPATRVNALLQHEVGTHMVTYYNGHAQPLRLLCTGLAGYDALQEGLAVLAEYLVDGLTVARFRVLAARVVAAHGLVEGASFTDVFRMLCYDHAFDPRVAYTVAMRTFRGGGLIKDVIYLRGLKELTDFLREGGKLGPLYVGKIALHHRPFVEELAQRGILRAPVLRPHCFDHEAAPTQLERIRNALTLIDFFSAPKET